MALDVLRSAKAILKTDDFVIDNVVFKLHYRVTVALLLGASLIGVAKQYFGDPINCQTASGVSSGVLDDYCWIHSTFHLRQDFQGSVGCLVDPELMMDKQEHTGFTAYFQRLSGQSPSSSASEQLSRATPDTSFYQWVPFVLLLQAALFYIPRKIWKSCEGGLMAAFGRESRGVLLLCHEESGELEKGVAENREELARKYSVFFSNRLHHNNGYFIQFLICEILNLVMNIVNIYLTDYFLSGRFMKYGSQVVKFLSYDKMSRTEIPNPLCTVFPTITSCTFHSVGTAAGEQKFNSLCVLSLNIVNEKVYLLLWFWFFGLCLLTGIHLVFRLTVITLPPLRYLLILLRVRGFTKTDLSTCRKVLEFCYLGDWFVLYQLSKNSNPYFFRYMLKHLEKNFVTQTRSRHSSKKSWKEDDFGRKNGDEAGRRRKGPAQEMHGSPDYADM